jgi:hypothetical protein
LANIELDSTRGPIAVRQMNFDRGRAIPNAGFIIGNLFVNSSNYQFAYYSLASCNVVTLGEPGKLTVEQERFYKKWNTYLEQMESKYEYSKYYQLYNIFDRPGDNNWDGCYRINTKKQGGLLFFYRNNSPDKERIFRIPCLEKQNRYKIYSHDSGRTIGIFSGRTLIEEGIKISIPGTYSGVILTIEKI